MRPELEGCRAWPMKGKGNREKVDGVDRLDTDDPAHFGRYRNR